MVIEDFDSPVGRDHVAGELSNWDFEFLND